MIQPQYCDICNKAKRDVDWRRDKLSGLRMLLCISCDLARVLQKAVVDMRQDVVE